MSWRKPSAERIGRFLDAQSKLPFSYAAVGASAHDPPAGYAVDHARLKLGEGEVVFRAGIAALKRWVQFDLGWVEAWPADTPIEPGQCVAVLGRAVGLWWLNACRIIDVVDTSAPGVNASGPISKYGFAYGTLPGHVESGEERFLIEWDQAGGDVWYDILAFSRPNELVARLGYPFVRRKQARFRRDSGASMLRAVHSEQHGAAAR